MTRGASRPVPCPWGCRKPVPSTVFVRFHPFRWDAEIRVCPECGRQAVFPSGERFLCKVDYAELEMRIVAQLSVQPGQDIHQATAEALGCSRAEAKVASFKALYGKGE